MIGIAGVARSGKDTLSLCFKKCIEEDFGLEVKIYSFANALRGQINDFLMDKYDISAFTQDEEEKAIIRPLLVAHGEQMKKKYGRSFWCEALFSKIENHQGYFPIISDVRFDFEAALIKSKNGQVVHISRNDVLPANETEKENDPLVSSVCDIHHCWPNYSPDSMSECQSHAEILWQILKEGQSEIWKTIYC